MFCRDKNNRAWIGGIENNSPIRTIGLRERWISGGDLTTPAYEYSQMIKDEDVLYANQNMRKGKYVDMFEQYLSKAPIIQDYLASQKVAKDKNDKKISSSTNKEKPFRGDHGGVFTREDIIKSLIDETKTFDELFAALDVLPADPVKKIPGIQGAHDFFSVPVLKTIIHGVVNGTKKVAEVTSVGGLRKKVLELIGKTMN